MIPQPPKDYVQAIAFPETVSLRPIGVVHSPYKERHGTPRQAELKAAPDDYQPVLARIELFPSQVPTIALRDLEQFERLWIISWLHLNHRWNPTVRIPRGPKIRRGTLATRAPHRPNPIGLSATHLIRIEELTLHIAGIDLLDQTPVLDIKPYVPYCDAFPQARCGYVNEIEVALEHEPVIRGASPLSEKLPTDFGMPIAKPKDA